MSTIKKTYHKLLAAFEPGGIESILFTTFNFSPNFFENNVLPLAGDMMTDDPQDLGQLSTAQVNETLLKTRVTVVCDKATNPSAKGHYRYGLLGVGLKGAFFHPKIILVTGKLNDGNPGAMLMVGSCNLTLSGWGLNREIAGLCRVGLQQQQALKPLLEWIHSRAEVQLETVEAMVTETVEDEGETLKNLSAITTFIEQNCTQALADEPKFYARVPSGKANPSPTFLSTLTDGLTSSVKSCQIVSPFWSAGGNVGPLLSSLNTKQISIVPSINNKGEYLLPKSIRALKINQTYARFEQSDRYTHAKSVTLKTDQKTHYIIGSANFTQAAMGPVNQGNVEAMLVYTLSNDNIPGQDLKPLETNSWANDKESLERMPQHPPYDTVACYDWKTGTFCCELQCNAADYSKITSSTFHQKTLVFEPQTDGSHRAKLKITLAKPVYSFTIHDNENQVYQGLVTQINGEADQLGYLPKPDLSTMLAQLRRMNPNPGTGGSRGYSPQTATSSDEPEDEVSDVFDFFSMFQAFYKLREYFANRPKANPFAASGNNNLPMLLRAIELDFDNQKAATPQRDDQQLIKHFIVLSELQVTAKKLAKHPAAKDATRLLNQVEAKITVLQPDFLTLIAKSTMLKQFLPDSSQQDPATTIYDWFKQQMEVTE